MLLTIKKIDGWYFVIIQDRQDHLGYSTEAAAKRRFNSILAGWI